MAPPAKTPAATSSSSSNKNASSTAVKEKVYKNEDFMIDTRVTEAELKQIRPSYKPSQRGKKNQFNTKEKPKIRIYIHELGPLNAIRKREAMAEGRKFREVMRRNMASMTENQWLQNAKRVSNEFLATQKRKLEKGKDEEAEDDNDEDFNIEDDDEDDDEASTEGDETDGGGN